MKVLLIRIRDYPPHEYVGETTLFDNVKEIKKCGEYGVELVVGEKSRVFVQFTNYRIEIL